MLASGQHFHAMAKLCILPCLFLLIIAVDRDLQGHHAGLDLADESQLSATDDLLDVLTDLPTRKHLHIIAKQCPGEWSCKYFPL
jgi:hypothetical protein